MNKKKLILFTDNFPYTLTKESFLEAEFEHLYKNFDLTIVSNDIESKECRNFYDAKVYRYSVDNNGFKFWYKVKKTLKYFITPCALREFFDIIKDGKNTLGRIKDSIYFYWSAEKKYEFLKKNKIIQKNKEAICYFFWNNFNPLALTLHKKKYKKIKLISRFHRYDLYNDCHPFLRQPFKKEMAKGLDKLVFIAKEGKEYFLKTFGHTFKDKTIVSYLGVSNNYIINETENKKIKIVSCSHLNIRKRIHLIIEALSKIDNLDISWTHYGDGPERINLQTLASNLLDAKNNIEYNFAGGLKNEQIMLGYSKSNYDLFILPSDSEGLPVCIMEALSFGIPIIATDVGGVGEMLENSNNILLNKNLSSDDLKNAIEIMLLKNKENLIEIKKQNISIFNDKFNANKNYKEFIKVLNSL